MEKFQLWLYKQFNWDSTKQAATRQFGLKFMSLGRRLASIHFTASAMFMALVSLFFVWQNLPAAALVNLVYAALLALIGMLLNWYCRRISNLLWLTEIAAITNETLAATETQAQEAKK